MAWGAVKFLLRIRVSFAVIKKKPAQRTGFLNLVFISERVYLTTTKRLIKVSPELVVSLTTYDPEFRWSI